MDNPTSDVRVLLVDPNVLFRCGIARLLDSQDDIEVIGEADDYLEGIHAAHRLQPDVMLLDSEWSEIEAANIVRMIKHQLPEMRLVVLTTEIQPDELLGCVLAGADGYLLKNITPDELFCRLRGLMRGEAAMSLATAATLMRRLSVSNCTLCLRASPNAELTPRESEVLELVARGMTNKRIGAVLRISEHTVRNHLCSIYQKLNLKNRLQVAVFSVTHGLVNMDSLT